MNMHAKQQILDTFADADLSIVEEVLYFNGWVSDEECGGYLMFRGIDGSIQQCEYGYSVMAEDKTNYFTPVEITEEEYIACVKAMDEAAQTIYSYI